MDPEPIAERLRRVRERILDACRRAGRSPDAVRIVAATKTAPPERIRELAAAGCRDVGENRIQEALPKIASLADAGLTWHFIGHLQTNKAKSVPGRFGWFHALDSVDLAERLDRLCRDAETRLSCLVEVNVAKDKRKSGIFVENLDELLSSVSNYPSLSIHGLMTMAPEGSDEKSLHEIFGTLRNLAGRHALPELSMGMSDDFSIAVEEGATMVRLGRILMGSRT